MWANYSRIKGKNMYHIDQKLRERKAQVLLPAVLLAPIFVLVVYLLFETAKVSITKIRHQFALDNAAYSQVSTTSTYLNAVAMTNGPLTYRVMQYLANGHPSNVLKPKESAAGLAPIDVFDVFYMGGGVPAAVGPNFEAGAGRNKTPTPETTDWKIKYYANVGEHTDPKYSRSAWEKETPQQLPEPLPITSKKLVADYIFDIAKEDNIVTTALQLFFETYVYVGSIYDSQTAAYASLIKNEITFREGYWLNVSDCKLSECARQSAVQLRKFLDIKTKPMNINEILFHYGLYNQRWGSYNGDNEMTMKTETIVQRPLFQFAYVDPSGRSKLKSFSRGVLLKQPFPLPRNHFNINLEQKYKPYVRNRVRLTCPRGNNNCVWPNTIPKYNVRLEP